MSRLRPLPYRHAPAPDPRRCPMWRPYGEFRFRPDASGALPPPPPRLPPKAVPQQDRAFLELGCRREAAARTDAGVLRLLRLALFGTRPLAARPPAAPVPSSAVRGGSARSE